MLKIYKYKDIDKTKLYKENLHYNSNLYFCGNIIYKIPYYKDENLVEKLSYLNKSGITELIKILGIIKDDKATVGYTFINYSNAYADLRNIKNRSIDDKYKDCVKLINIFNKLLNKNICYFDCHLGNVLLNLNTNDIKLCDIDDIIISEDKNLKIDSLRCLAILLISYLYDITKNNVTDLLRKDNYIFNSNGMINEYFKKLSSGKLIDFSCVLNQLDCNLIEQEKEDIKPKLFELNRKRFRV